MQGISTLATIVSVFSFSLTCVVVLYPNLSRFKSRWKGVAFYGGISAGTLLVAALTAPDPALPDQAWSWVDWTVIGLGVGGGLAVTMKRFRWPRKKQTDGPVVQTRGERSVNKRSETAKKKPSR